MNKTAADLPEQLTFIVDVVADITLDKYSSALKCLAEGAKTLAHSEETILAEDWDYAISAFENAVTYKLGSNGLLPPGGEHEVENHGELVILITQKLRELVREFESFSSETNGVDVRLCGFCGKGKDDVTQLIAGWGGYICGGCVGVCNQILESPRGENP